MHCRDRRHGEARSKRWPQPQESRDSRESRGLRPEDSADPARDGPGTVARAVADRDRAAVGETCRARARHGLTALATCRRRTVHDVISARSGESGSGGLSACERAAARDGPPRRRSPDC
jgi:hypothetical protein